MKKSLIALCIFFLIIIFFTIAALIPRNSIDFTPYGGDDFAHIYRFLILSFLLCFSGLIYKRYIYLILFSYGLFIEILQFVVGVGRNFSYLDISYNFIGIGLGLISYFLFSKIKKYNK